MHALVLAWVGPKDVCWERFGGARAAAHAVGAVSQVRNALDAMLRCGMAHGDVREDNAVWDAVEGAGVSCGPEPRNDRGRRRAGRVCQALS